MKYSNINEQIAKLRSQNLIIHDEAFAKHRLELFGYSNLIKSYRDPYIIVTDEGKRFRSDVTFEQLCSLYLLDKNLRNSVIAAMLDLEEHIKEAAADVIAKSFGVNQNEYLHYKNYQNKRKYKRRFTLAGVLDTLTNTLNTDKEPIHHYQTKYGIVPPWILFKSVYFSTIINFIDQFKAPQQEMLVERLYSVDLGYPKNKLVHLMMDTLFICLEYRNIAAHGGRIYNYQCRRELHYTENPPISYKGFSLLLRLLEFMKYDGPYLRLSETLNYMLTEHCNRFPQDVTYLEQILNISISERHIVWAANKSNKYHENEHCSGLRNARELDLDEALSLGLVKCKKCCR